MGRATHTEHELHVSPKRARLRRWIGIAFFAAIALRPIYELYLPTEIPWENTQLEDMPARRADGLVLQDALGSDVWASRGFALYRSRAGGPFERELTLRPRFGAAWAGYLRTLRDVFRYQELVELMALDENTLLAFAGGDAYRVDLVRGEATRVHTLRYYGPGRGRGLMPHGLTRDADGVIYYGEYPTGTLSSVETVRLWRSLDEALSWEVAHDFAPGEVRHIHAAQWDPYGNALWVATGDRNPECRIGYSRDRGTTFTWVGQGDQRFRAISFLFTPKAVSWAMDSPPAVKQLVHFDRATNEIASAPTVFPHPGYYAAALMGEEGVITLGETDASLWIVDGDRIRRRLGWEVEPDASLPHPVIRLLRSRPSDPDVVLLNPLRTTREEASIYSISRMDLIPGAP
jgi:hypothetical protein